MKVQCIILLLLAMICVSMRDSSETKYANSTELEIYDPTISKSTELMTRGEYRLMKRGGSMGMGFLIAGAIILGLGLAAAVAAFGLFQFSLITAVTQASLNSFATLLLAGGGAFFAGGIAICATSGCSNSGKLMTISGERYIGNISQKLLLDPLVDISSNSSNTLRYTIRSIDGSTSNGYYAMFDSEGMLSNYTSETIFNDTNRNEEMARVSAGNGDKLSIHIYNWYVSNNCGANAGAIIREAVGNLASTLAGKDGQRSCIGLRYKGCNVAVLKIYIDSKENMWKAPSNHACTGEVTKYTEVYKREIRDGCSGCRQCGNCRDKVGKMISPGYIGMISELSDQLVGITEYSNIDSSRCTKSYYSNCNNFKNAGMSLHMTQDHHDNDVEHCKQNQLEYRLRNIHSVTVILIAFIVLSVGSIYMITSYNSMTGCVYTYISNRKKVDIDTDPSIQHRKIALLLAICIIFIHVILSISLFIVITRVAAPTKYYASYSIIGFEVFTVLAIYLTRKLSLSDKEDTEKYARSTSPVHNRTASKPPISPQNNKLTKAHSYRIIIAYSMHYAQRKPLPLRINQDNVSLTREPANKPSKYQINTKPPITYLVNTQ
ncbi:hypothetical protein HK099_003901 [Clydaea vesicula]|uniref:Uncharacterized protein n=1 Tax=Clydaea vesicula TaxID=447962 RepID=A0AAD5XYK0_9FUNG|nr:hypothetical protein HK099_003901 [Clydaea vesicula]